MPKHMRAMHGEYRRKPKYLKPSIVPITYKDNFDTKTEKMILIVLKIHKILLRWKKAKMTQNVNL